MLRGIAGGEFFRAGVGAVIVNEKGQILVLRRAGTSPGAWQLPQGGLQEGEGPRDALWRELEEETGISPRQLAILDQYPEWTAYELPGEYRNEKVGRGQVQKWFLCRLADEFSRVRPDGAEFDAYEWVEKEELLKRAVAFRLPVYRRVLEYFSPRLRPGKE